MISWIKQQDPYALFLWVVLGIPGICVAIAALGSLSLAMYFDMVGHELNLLALIGLIVFFGPGSLAIAIGIVCDYGDAVGDMSAEDFVKGWGIFILVTVVLFLIPALIVLGVKALIL